MTGSDPDRLFPDTTTDTEPATRAEPEPRAGRRRLRCAVRNQVEMRCCCLDDLLPEEHQARIVWNWVCSIDLSELIDSVQAVEGGPGQAPMDPRIPMALWLYATLRGIAHGRELARRCESDVAFQWILGGVSTNHHTLSDFRTGHGELLDRLLTDSVAALLTEGLVTLDRVAQDGMRVRASAGAASFHRAPTLEEALALAEEQLRALEEERESGSDAGRTRAEAARERSARERAERLRLALDQLPEIARKKKVADRQNARCSSTDPDARVMKMSDGGFRPAYNVQFATTTGTQIITGVDVVNTGSDQGQLAPMIGQHADRYDEVPGEALVDGGFVKRDDVEAVSPPIDAAGNPEADRGTVVYAPVTASRDPNRDPHTPRADDGPAVREWRRRMATEEAKTIYRERAATAECVNAIARNRGLQQFAVRGLEKVRAVTLWYALAHNLMRAVGLRAAAAAAG